MRKQPHSHLHNDFLLNQFSWLMKAGQKHPDALPTNLSITDVIEQAKRLTNFF